MREGARRAALQEMVDLAACPTCGAGRGQWCPYTEGREVHMGRGEAADAVRARLKPPPAVAGWLREHGDDPVQVKLIDLISLIARLEQVSREPDFETVSFTHERIFTCDLPRLRDYLPEEAVEIIDADIGS